MPVDRDPLAHFQDREDAILAFDRLWDDRRTWLLAFDGFSGYGKSTLINWLEVNRCQRDKMPYSLLSFEYELADKNLLDGMLAGFQQHLSATAFQAYQDKRDEIVKDRDQRKASVTINETQLGGSGNEQTINANMAEMLREIDRQARERLTDAWLAYLGNLKQARCVIFLDTFERYQETASEGDLGWLWATLEQAHKNLPGLRVIIGSRERVNAPERGSSDARLAPFSPEHSDALLASLGVTDAAFRTAVYERLAKGHPLVTFFAADAWTDAQQSSKPFTAAEVPDLGELEDAVEWIQKKIVDRFKDDDPLKEAVRWVAILRSFNLDVLNAILKLNLNANQFRRLTRYAFVEREAASGTWRSHYLMRRVQLLYLPQEQPRKFMEYQQNAITYFAESDPLEALYHRFFVEPDQAFDDWQGKQERAYEQYRYDLLNRLFAIVESAEIDIRPEQYATIKLRRGRHYYYQGDMHRARENYEAALPLFEGVQDSLGKANVLRHLGDLERVLGNIEVARAEYIAALLLFEATQDLFGKANTLLGVANLEYGLGNVTAARAQYTAALPLFVAVQDSLGIANTLRELGNMECILGNMDAARTQYTAALLMFEAIQDLRGKAYTWQDLGYMETLLGNLEAARAQYTAALPLFEAVQDPLGKANTLQGLGELERKLGNLEAARAQYTAALPLFEVIQDVRGKANTLRGLGDLECDLGNMDAARTQYTAALPLFEVIRDVRGKANALQGLGHVESLLGNLEAARVQYTAALSLFEVVQDLLGKATTLYSLGDLERSFGNMEAARARYIAALPLFEGSKEPMGQMNVALGLARLERSSGNVTVAEGYYLKMFKIAEELGLGNHPVSYNIRHEFQEMKDMGK